MSCLASHGFIPQYGTMVPEVDFPFVIFYFAIVASRVYLKYQLCLYRENPFPMRLCSLFLLGSYGTGSCSVNNLGMSSVCVLFMMYFCAVAYYASWCKLFACCVLVFQLVSLFLNSFFLGTSCADFILCHMDEAFEETDLILEYKSCLAVC